jgi:hypothetical protein
LIDEAGSTSTNAIQGNYFRKEVWQYDSMGDYTDPDLIIPVNSIDNLEDYCIRVAIHFNQMRVAIRLL